MFSTHSDKCQNRNSRAECVTEYDNSLCSPPFLQLQENSAFWRIAVSMISKLQADSEAADVQSVLFEKRGPAVPNCVAVYGKYILMGC